MRGEFPNLLENIFLTSKLGRIEQKHWLEGNIQKYKVVFSEDALVETLNYAEGSLESLELKNCTPNLLPIRYGHYDPSENASSD